jgi:spermidine/putrescine-binding protein
MFKLSRLVPRVASHMGLLGLILLSLNACTCSPSSQVTSSEQAGGGQGNSLHKEVNLAIWSNYVTDETIAAFKQATGIEVRISNYSSNEELLAKLQAGGSGIDVAVPSDYMVAALQKLNLVEPLNHALLPNMEGLDPNMKGREFDPTNQWSLPYGWTLTGIAVNRDLFKGNVASWKDLITHPELKGRVSLLDDAREALGAVLRTQGGGINSTDQTQIEAAKTALISAKPWIRAYTSEPRDLLVRGEVAAAQIYSSDALQARRETGGKIEFIVPEDGATMAIDNLVIPKGATNVAAAHALINHLLSPESNVSYVNTILAGPVVMKTAELLDPNLKADTGLFPPKEKMERLEMARELGDVAALWDRAWTEVKVRGGRG